jgi:hypothetical protein
MEISAPLEKILHNDRVEVVAVILKNPDGLEPEALAKSLAAAWCESPHHAVVLHIPEREGSPWIAVGGDLISSIDQHEVRDELANAPPSGWSWKPSPAANRSSCSPRPPPSSRSPPPRCWPSGC